MSHILNIFITQKSSNSFIFNCSLIFRYMNKPQENYPFPYPWQVGHLECFTKTENNEKMFLCVLPVCTGQTFSNVYASKSWGMHTSNLLKYHYIGFQIF